MKIKAILNYLISVCVVLNACQKSGTKTDLCIQKGNFEATLTETGELLAVNARSVLVPYVGWKYGWQFKITGLVEHGSHVVAGDSVAQIDPANVMKFLLEKETQLETEKANLNKLLVEQENKHKELEARLREVQADYNLKKLELQKFDYESPRKKEIKELEFQQAIINLDKVKRSIELEKTISGNALKIQKIKVSQLENDIKEAHTAIGKLTIPCPIDGIFQISENRRTDQMYRLGDDTYQGAELALVPDLSKIKVTSTINETDIGKVKRGKPVIVRLEAFPDKAFEGKVSEIGKLSYKKEEKSRIKVFDFEILLNDSDPVLKPGMTVSCEVYYAELQDVYYVSNDCLKNVEGTYYLYMRQNNNWVERPVEIGPRNNNYTVVYGDFKQGTKLMLPDKTVIAQSQQ